MASDIASTLARLSEKSRFLTERYRVVMRERDEALTRVAELERQLTQDAQQIERLKAENEYFRVSSVMAPTAETVDATRAMIKGIISDIDKCLEELEV